MTSEQVAVQPVSPKPSAVDKTWNSKFEIGVPINVYIAFIKDNVIYVSEADKTQTLIEKIAGIDIKTMTDVSSPRVGSLYLHNFAECWCR
ncbi:hypothetical protein, partial [Salmonella sp. s58078]|uniref:hypothetical protein n=1 Tax=Salmonella sp. s58078 TaxID=3159699 RepID=UPI0039803667